MQQIWERITKLQAAGQLAVLATIIATRGSTPRNVGTKMLVLSDGSIMGTLGGGCAEAEVWQAAMRVNDLRRNDRRVHRANCSQCVETSSPASSPRTS